MNPILISALLLCNGVYCALQTYPVDVKAEQEEGPKKVAEHLHVEPDRAVYDKEVHVKEDGGERFEQVFSGVYVSGGNPKLIEESVSHLEPELPQIKKVVQQHRKQLEKPEEKMKKKKESDEEKPKSPPPKPPRRKFVISRTWAARVVNKAPETPKPTVEEPAKTSGTEAPKPSRKMTFTDVSPPKKPTTPAEVVIEDISESD